MHLVLVDRVPCVAGAFEVVVALGELLCFSLEHTASLEQKVVKDENALSGLLREGRTGLSEDGTPGEVAEHSIPFLCTFPIA